MTFHRLQTRILALFVLLMVVVQLGGFLLINTVGVSAARKTIGEELARGARVFDRLREQDSERLVQSARLLSADYAFREAVATGGGDKIASMMWSHGMRVDADIMMLVGLDGRVVADTSRDAWGKPFPFPRLLADAANAQRASSIAVVRGRLHELVIVPVLLVVLVEGATFVYIHFISPDPAPKLAFTEVPAASGSVGPGSEDPRAAGAEVLRALERAARVREAPWQRTSAARRSSAAISWPIRSCASSSSIFSSTPCS